jgi:hypothetical protein
METTCVKSYEAHAPRTSTNNKEDKYNAAYFAYFDRKRIPNRGAFAMHPIPKGARLLEDPELRKLRGQLPHHEAGHGCKVHSGEYDNWLSEL